MAKYLVIFFWSWLEGFSAKKLA